MPTYRFKATPAKLRADILILEKKKNGNNLQVHILKTQSRSKNLTAINGRLKAQKPRSENANDSRNGVVGCRRRLLFRRRTYIVKIFPKQPKIEQIMAPYAAIVELNSSMIGSVPS